MIWIIGGTSTSIRLASELTKRGMDYIVTTATTYGSQLYGDGRVVCGRMDAEKMGTFIRENEIELIIDASHPYAEEVSKNALRAGAAAGIPHLRMERKTLSYDGCMKFRDYDGVCEYLKERDGNVLVTTGSNNIEQFLGEGVERYFFRILPVEESIRKVREAGISPKNIIALQGPFSEEFNRAIMDNYGIRYLITKESGQEGGELEKVRASLASGREVLVIERPHMDYERVYYEIDEMIEFIVSRAGGMRGA